MALDFSQYAQSYGGAGPQGAGAALGAGISRAIPGVQDKLNVAKSDTFNEIFSPLQDYMTTPVEDWGELGTVPSFGLAYMNFKNSLSPRQSRLAKRDGSLNALTFKQEYDAQLSAYAPEIKAKLDSYRVLNNKSEKGMRLFLGDKPGLNSFLLGNTTSEELVTGLSYLQPTRSFKQWWQDKSAGEKVGTVIKPPIAGGLAVRAGMGIAREGFKGRYSPFKKSITAKDIKGAAKGLTKTAQDVGMGKGKVGLKKISAYLKKNGMKGLFKLVGKKAGTKGLVKLAGRGVLSLGMKGTGVGALASLGMDAATVMWIYNMIQGEE